jgi:hypothetical protein
VVDPGPQTGATRRMAPGLAVEMAAAVEVTIMMSIVTGPIVDMRTGKMAAVVTAVRTDMTAVVKCATTAVETVAVRADSTVVNRAALIAALTAVVMKALIAEEAADLSTPTAAAVRTGPPTPTASHWVGHTGDLPTGLTPLTLITAPGTQTGPMRETTLMMASLSS